jgi:putative component of membrane protein insertase Oxa1/YidC/SpoIIIJ protein YidD
MKRLALTAIRLYQRYISPHKGFCCAYRFHTGKASCSALGFRAIQRHGVLEGLDILRKRLQRCSIAYHRYGQHQAPLRHWKKQSGFCNIDCGACPDFGSCDNIACDCLPSLCDLSNIINIPCGGYASQPKETDVHIPPQVSHHPMASLSSKLSLQSQTQDQIVLPEAQALQAIQQLHEKGFHILGWHAWIQTTDGVIEQHPTRQNPDELAKLPRKQAAETCKHSIQQYAQQWAQEHPNTTNQLYFCLRVPPKQSSARNPISMS